MCNNPCTVLGKNAPNGYTEIHQSILNSYKSNIYCPNNSPRSITNMETNIKEAVSRDLKLSFLSNKDAFFQKNIRLDKFDFALW